MRYSIFPYYGGAEESAREGRIRHSILLIEDEELAAEGLRLVLSDEGFDVEVVVVGREAIGRIIRNRPAVVVLDVTLRDIDGIVLAKMIRTDWPDLPIVLTSGYAQPAGMSDLLPDRLTAFLQKPFEIDVLIDEMRKLLSKSSR